VKAYQLTRWQAEPEVREVPVPEPQPGQVLVKVGGAGACAGDIGNGRCGGGRFIVP